MLADQVAGLLMFGFQGTAAADVPRDLVAQAGGVVLFRRNIKDAQQVRELTDAIRSLARDGEAPPLIALDQEGGTVSRLAQIGTTTPSAMALGAVRDPAATESMYRLIGDELGTLGFTVDFAPVADINNNPDNPVIGLRSFGDDPHAVGLNVRAAIRGLHAASVAATAKHFPGHGDTTIDSHFDLPSIPHDLAHVRAVELVPFSAAITEGVDAIMTAHALFPAIEEQGKPATLSHRILSELLRDELRYQGVVVTDCMEMKAIEAHHTPEAAAVEAVAAGADLILFSHTPDKVRRARDALRAAVLEGRLSGERVQQSLQRVAKLRRRLAANNISRPPLDTVGSERHKQAALAGRSPRDHLGPRSELSAAAALEQGRALARHRVWRRTTFRGRRRRSPSQNGYRRRSRRKRGAPPRTSEVARSCGSRVQTDAHGVRICQRGRRDHHASQTASLAGACGRRPSDAWQASDRGGRTRAIRC